MIALVVLVLAAATALLTWTVGWWTVILIGVAAGAAWRHRRHAALAALAAALGWGALLAYDARAGRLGALGGALGGVFPVPSPVLMLMTVLFAAAAAWSGAAIAGELRRLAARP